MNSIAMQRARSTESVVALAPWCMIAAALLPLAATRGWATYTVHHVLLFVAMVGLGWSGLLGSSWLARAAGVLSAAGFAALAVAEPLFVVNKSASFPFYGIERRTVPGDSKGLRHGQRARAIMVRAPFVDGVRAHQCNSSALWR